MIYSVHEAKTQFSKLLDMVGEGEDVVIIRHGEPAVRPERVDNMGGDDYRHADPNVRPRLIEVGDESFDLR